MFRSFFRALLRVSHTQFESQRYSKAGKHLPGPGRHRQEQQAVLIRILGLAALIAPIHPPGASMEPLPEEQKVGLRVKVSGFTLGSLDGVMLGVLDGSLD